MIKLFTIAGFLFLLDCVNSQSSKIPTTDVIDLVEKLDESTKKEHKAWKLKVEMDERERRSRIFKVLPKLSIKTQQKLIRIVMTQQNQTLSIGEKERILRHISSSMDGPTKLELGRFLSDNDLYSLIY